MVSAIDGEKYLTKPFHDKNSEQRGNKVKFINLIKGCCKKNLQLITKRPEIGQRCILFDIY